MCHLSGTVDQGTDYCQTALLMHLSQSVCIPDDHSEIIETVSMETAVNDFCEGCISHVHISSVFIKCCMVSSLGFSGDILIIKMTFLVRFTSKNVKKNCL